MAYNKRYFLERVIEIQDIVMREKDQGSYQIWIYKNVIKDKFHISYSTFNNYLGTNARRELAKLEENQLVASQ